MKIIKWLHLCASITCFMLPLSLMAEDISSVDADNQEQIRQQERLRLLRQQQEPQPNIRDAIDQLKQSSTFLAEDIPEQESPCFIISTISLTGDDSSKFQFALDEVIADAKQPSAANAILGRCLGVGGINAVMARLQNAIISKGFITSRVLAAPQDLKTGSLVLTVIPGRINSIRLTPDSSLRANTWNAIPMNKGDLLNLRDIEQALENFKRVPTAEADIQIEPAPPTSEGIAEKIESSGKPKAQLTAQPGLSDVVIHYKQHLPFRMSLHLDDSGFNSTGKYQGGMTLSGDNLLTLNDLLYLNYNHDLGGGETGRRGNNGYNAHYSLPWHYWLFSANTSSNNFHQTVAGANQSYLFSGHSQYTEVKVSRLLFRNSINKTSASLKGFLRQSNNYIDDTEIEVQRRRTAGWELGFNQSWFLGSAILDYNLSYRHGTGAQGALPAPEQNFGEGTSRMRLLTGDLNLLFPFSMQTPWGKQSLQYNATWRGQTNFTPLTPQDRFSIGSRYTVRGFDGQQILIADNGWLLRNELIAPILQTGQAIYWGLDYGQVGGQSSALLVGKQLTGSVIGLRGSGLASGLKALNGFNYDIFIGKPINKPAGFSSYDTTAGFNLSWSY
jgi:hemolysin activation/secretion protein